ncbi:hypothetical protein J6590_013612 [Homalodisca vitripennis]|nr:hypothetical protein J6590_013612 [Homalodisca vitripennis]
MLGFYRVPVSVVGGTGAASLPNETTETKTECPAPCQCACTGIQPECMCSYSFHLEQVVDFESVCCLLVCFIYLFIMPVSLVPEYLLKEDLHFELLARGLTPGSDCESMRKQLRDNMDLDTTWPRDLTFHKQRPILEAKLETFENSQEDWLESPPTGRERARYLSRLTHLHMRLSLLRSKLTSSGDREWLEERITLVDGLLTVERDEGAKAPEKTVSAVDSAAAVKGEGQIPGSVVAEVSGVDGARGPVTQMPAGSGGLGTVMTGSFVQYHKLPNPLTPLLQRLPTVDGLDTEALLRFLSEILRLHDLPGLQGASFLHVISPFCRPPLGDCLVRVLQRGGTLDDFHREALDFFVPNPLRERLRVEKFFRPQGNGESLAKFVAEVRDTDRVLRLDIPEGTVVTTILEGLNPEESSRLVFAGRPSTFSELDRLCIASRSVSLLTGRGRRGTIIVPSSPPGLSRPYRIPWMGHTTQVGFVYPSAMPVVNKVILVGSVLGDIALVQKTRSKGGFI